MANKKKYFEALQPIKHNGAMFKIGAVFKGDPPEKFEKDLKTIVGLVKIGALREVTAAIEEKQPESEVEIQLTGMTKSEIIKYAAEQFGLDLNKSDTRELLIEKTLVASKKDKDKG